jgi:hypothetical protein
LREFEIAGGERREERRRFLFVSSKVFYLYLRPNPVRAGAQLYGAPARFGLSDLIIRTYFLFIVIRFELSD